MSEINSSDIHPQAIQYDQDFLERAKIQIKSLANPDIEFSGKKTPKILFHGFGTKASAFRMFKEGKLNPTRELIWFTNTPQRAAMAYGMRLELDFQEAVVSAGLFHHQEEGHEDWYAANRLKEDTNYIAVVFPHEDTDLGKWVVDKTGPTIFSQSREYITEQDLSLDKVLFVRLAQLRGVIVDIESGNLNTKQQFIEKVGITSESQTQARRRMLAELSR